MHANNSHYLEISCENSDLKLAQSLICESTYWSLSKIIIRKINSSSIGLLPKCIS